MMSASVQISHTINQIVEELSPEECKRLSYLCEAPHTTVSEKNIREMLHCLVDQSDQTVLIELLLKMRRFDLLRRVLDITKSQAEGLLKNCKTSLSEYRVLMAEVSEEVGSKDLESLVFLLRGTLPKEKLEKLESFLDVVVELERLDQISSTRMEVMEKYFRAIHRLDLARRLNQFQSHKRAETRSPTSIAVQNRDDWLACRDTVPFSGISSTSCNVRPVVSKPCASTAGSTVTLQAVPFRTSCQAHICTQNAPVRTVYNEQRQEEVYRMQAEPRGVCLIIDCVGTEGGLLKHFFESLNFAVSLHMLLSVESVLSTLQQISRKMEHYSGDAFICCIISRSRSSQLLGTNPGGRGLELKYVRHFFNSSFCPWLAGKPKLFFIQTYKISEVRNVGGASEEGMLEMDSPVQNLCRVVEVAEDADIFWSHCWTDEGQLEKRNHQSVYLQSLREGLTEGLRRRIHLVDVHTSVNQTVYNHNHNHPESVYHINLRHTLRKQVYLR
ncbi:CASP8 and FADD-like apoptosis regulator [Trichomycterus rosablanca]|uniref:CASP8 and FADD-like apoptosis regulator n=1 Tax=Trichomycterus rosablanca TaxID=2290929 RepID=UPI002F353FEA